jgi:hypothetical protein
VGSYGSQRVDECHPCVAASFTNWQINSQVAQIRSSISTGYSIIVLGENIRWEQKGTMTIPINICHLSFIIYHLSFIIYAGNVGPSTPGYGVEL